MSVPKIVRGKKLLVASVGVAAVSYACSSSSTNSTFHDSTDAATDDVFISSGNLGAPVDSGAFVDSGTSDDGGDSDGTADAGGDASGDAGTD